MKITDDIIKDLISIYNAGEASDDTIRLLENYAKEHPEYEQILKKKIEDEIIINNVDLTLESEEEMFALKKTKSLLRLKSTLLAVAVLCTALPLSFGDVSWAEREGVHWLWEDFPEGAFIIGTIAVFAWFAYMKILKRLKVTDL